MPVVRQYIVGQGVVLSALFKDPDGIPTDPTTITLRTKQGLSESIDHVYGVDQDVDKTDTGKYEYALLLEESGTLVYRWIGTGTVAASADSSILVWPPLV